MGKKISTMTDSGRKSGRAVFDNQGRASWEWQTATGVFQTDVTNEQLAGLEAAGLAGRERGDGAWRVWTVRRAHGTAAARTPCRCAIDSAQALCPPRSAKPDPCLTILSRAGDSR